ncbi:glycosyltransferase family 4 protein [Microbacterium sp. ASV49]|uniref:D-inositol 3-phosphate glycosyltransferase n=1 Tax=Microbacterium candidum TaxID=3041922 RepID=A0ABT7MUZ9_9MICO|nr:glycosyltransferase family 4 protein [Microbacterium sp. ASV49]MDL9978274.1 glycosyltransferase family 4 protein [Microbacterium sp. ASV49]
MARVALITSSYAPRIGGVEEHVANVARELHAAGDEVAVWAVDQGDEPVSETDFPVRYLPCPLPARSLRPAVGFAARSPAALAAWRSANRTDRPDIWHIQCFGPNGLYANALAGDRPLVYSHHGETFMDDVFEQSRLLRNGLSRVLRRADAVTSCSAFAARDLDRWAGPRAVDIVPNGVDLSEPIGVMPPDLIGRRYVLGIGRLVPVKGFDSLIRAFATLLRSGSVSASHDLVLAGDGPDRGRLESLASEEGISARVRFVGALDRGSVGAVMQGASALVVPSRVEAFGITVLEGWRAGIPVIATSNGGPADLIDEGRNGLLARPDTPADIVRALGAVLSDRDLAASLGNEGRRSVRGFTWKATAEAYREVYARLT